MLNGLVETYPQNGRTYWCLKKSVCEILEVPVSEWFFAHGELQFDMHVMTPADPDVARSQTVEQMGWFKLLHVHVILVLC